MKFSLLSLAVVLVGCLSESTSSESEESHEYVGAYKPIDSDFMPNKSGVCDTYSSHSVSELGFSFDVPVLCEPELFHDPSDPQQIINGKDESDIVLEQYQDISTAI